jgi:hypothetical protein
MDIVILETDAKTFFSNAKKLEKTCPEGRWKYCKFLNENTVTGIFESDKPAKGSFNAHDDFFKYFLGLFSPKLEKTFKLHQEKTFNEFCTKLNSLLNEEIKIYDLSVTQKWIWSEGDATDVPEKLLAFLDFE